MEIRGEGFLDEDQEGPSAHNPEKSVYVLHPNCAVEEF